MEADKDGYNIDVVSKPFTPEEQHNQFKALSDNEMSQEILRMIIRSVQKSERRKSSRNNKRKRQVKPTTQTNGSDADDEKKAYSRCSITFLFEVLQKVRSCPKYVELVKWMGFGEILELDACVVPRSFVKWIADNVCTEKEEIRIDSKSVPLTPQSVKDTLGTPTGELSVDSDELIGKAAFLALFGLTEVPSIRYFGKKILAKEILPDDVFCRCFMAVSLGTFYCPNSNTKLSTKYMGALVDVDKIKDRNWTKFIHEWLMIYIKKFLKEPKNAKHLTQTLGGCIYHLAVRLLDFIDFGSIQMPTTLPRIKVWKGSLIKVFSDMYMGTTGKFGAYPIKDISQTCYADNTNKDTGGVSSDETLKNSINTAIGDTVGYKLKEVISTTFVNIMKDEDCGVCAKAQDLVLQVLHAFLSNENGSQDTVKLSSSAQGSYKTAINTGSTEKIQSQDEEVDYDNDALIRRKRRRTEENSSSQHSIESNNTRIHQQKTQYQDSTHTKSTIPEGTKLYSQNEQAASDVAFSQGVQSASLQHMLAENNVTPNSTTPCMDVSSKETNPLNKHNDTIGVIASLMDLNIKCNEDENQDFKYATGRLLCNWEDSPPDVQILSVRSLKNTHNRMSQETDEMYNTSLSLGNSTSHYGKENFLPQRIPQRSKVYCSPFDVNPSAPPVEPIEQKIWEAVTTLCDIEDHKTMWAVNIDNIRVSMFQLGSSMKLNGKVEAWLMNSFCRKLFRDNHPRTTNKHFFFNTTSDYFLKKWKSEDARIHWQKKAIESLIWANKAKSLLSSDGLYFPSVFNNHWFVFLVDMKYRNFIFLDSFFGKNSTFHKEVANLMIESFEKTWQEAGFRNINFKTFGRAYPNVPKQRNGSNDCGIFVMKYMEFFCARNQSKCTFSHLDIPIFRVKYAHDILMCDYNSEYEAKILAAGFNA